MVSDFAVYGLKYMLENRWIETGSLEHCELIDSKFW